MESIKHLILMSTTFIFCCLSLSGCSLIKAAPTGTGLAAKVMCSTVFISDRNPDGVTDQDLLITKKYMIRTRVDSEEKSVKASVFGMFPQKAIYREGLGCTLVIDTTEEALYKQAADFKPATIKDATDLTNADSTIAGVDSAMLEQALDEAFSEPDPDKPIRTRGVVIIHSDRVIAERYADGFTRDTPQISWSMTKSVTNALTGILVRQGRLTVNDPAPVPEWSNPEDPRHTITLDHLLHMSSGLAFTEVYEEDPLADLGIMLCTQNDTGAFAANKPLIAEPGSKWAYSSGTTNIISRIIRDAVPGTDTDYFNFPREELFNKLGMTSAVIEPDASGTFVGSSYMCATPRDWGKLGRLYLNGGVWEGERILPEGWVEYSTRPTPHVPPGQGYGAHLWLNIEQEGVRWMQEIPDDAYAMLGHDGQVVLVVPSRDLVIVRMGCSSGYQCKEVMGFMSLVLEALPKG